MLRAMIHFKMIKFKSGKGDLSGLKVGLFGVDLAQTVSLLGVNACGLNFGEHHRVHLAYKCYIELRQKSGNLI